MVKRCRVCRAVGVYGLVGSLLGLYRGMVVGLQGDRRVECKVGRVLGW